MSEYFEIHRKDQLHARAMQWHDKQWNEVMMEHNHQKKFTPKDWNIVAVLARAAFSVGWQKGYDEEREK